MIHKEPAETALHPHRPQVGTRVLFMDGGNIAEQNNPKDFFENPKNPRLQEFLSKVL